MFSRAASSIADEYGFLSDPVGLARGAASGLYETKIRPAREAIDAAASGLMEKFGQPARGFQAGMEDLRSGAFADRQPSLGGMTSPAHEREMEERYGPMRDRFVPRTIREVTESSANAGVDAARSVAGFLDTSGDAIGERWERGSERQSEQGRQLRSMFGVDVNEVNKLRAVFGAGALDPALELISGPRDGVAQSRSSPAAVSSHGIDALLLQHHTPLEIMQMSDEKKQERLEQIRLGG
jgi:hypothetical protein